ncbi:hypothetical protein ACH5RR_010181 [Cinchona calisaya]|uniref:C2H2-type domain-containing protein n=1 Tax=Cinchona calisaya TaxID=153742 RepID=A0ABD3AGT4_9GENT
MASLRPLLSNFLYLLLLLLHLGCFIFTASSPHLHSKKRKLPAESPPPSPPTCRLKITPSKVLSSSWSFVKRIFSSKPTTTPTSSLPILSPSSSTRSLAQPIIISLNSPTRPVSESDISSDQHFCPLRNDIYPCPICGEIFQNPNLLEQHQSVKHAVAELHDGDTGKNIVKIIFKTGWPEWGKDPVVHRILKIHCSPKTLMRFEEYRECVMSRAARNGGVRRRDERCIADGNELLRFHCTTFMCELGQNGNSSLCNHQYCSVCGIVRSGFSPKMDGISTLPTSWRAHVSIPEDIEEEFKFMHVKRAMLVCRVIAGRIGCEPDDVDVDKQDPGFDSLVGRENGGVHARLDEEDELLVFNPRAVLPCFVIVYNV